MNSVTPPRNSELQSLPIAQHIFDATVSWHAIVKKFPKRERFSTGERIFTNLVNAMVEVRYAQFTGEKTEKASYITRAIRSINTVILLVRFCNEIQEKDKPILPDEIFFRFSDNIENIARMLGGWRRDILNPKKT